jgi:GPH family glycoside/pentoside/hexuronide:cation symporter
VLPHVLISQLIDEDESRTGASRAAMFFGMQGFFTKWMYGLSLWLFTLLLSRYGNSPEEPGGLILVGPVAAACSLLALVVYSRYPEREVLAAAPSSHTRE